MSHTSTSAHFARACCVLQQTAMTTSRLCLSLCMLALTAAGCGGDGGESCVGGVDPSCAGSACGGDVVGIWQLVSFCGPSCVTSVYETVEFDDDGTYRGGGYTGTWEIANGNLVTTVLGNSGSASFCVEADRMWTQYYANCGTESGPLTIVRERDCAGGEEVDARTR